MCVKNEPIISLYPIHDIFKLPIAKLYPFSPLVQDLPLVIITPLRLSWNVSCHADTALNYSHIISGHRGMVSSKVHFIAGYCLHAKLLAFHSISCWFHNYFGKCFTIVRLLSASVSVREPKQVTQKKGWMNKACLHVLDFVFPRMLDPGEMTVQFHFIRTSFIFSKAASDKPLSQSGRF